MAADSGACSVLLLLDLSTAFDTIDHSVLIDRQWAGITGTAGLVFLANRKLFVSVGEFTSRTTQIKHP